MFNYYIKLLSQERELQLRIKKRESIDVDFKFIYDSFKCPNSYLPSNNEILNILLTTGNKNDLYDIIHTKLEREIISTAYKLKPMIEDYKSMSLFIKEFDSNLLKEME